MSIVEDLQKILTARYGKDVRQSIHDSIKTCYDEGKAGSIDLEARAEIEEINEKIDGFSLIRKESFVHNAILKTSKARALLQHLIIDSTNQLVKFWDGELSQGNTYNNNGVLNPSNPNWVSSKNLNSCKGGDEIKVVVSTTSADYVASAIVYYKDGIYMSDIAGTTGATTNTFTVPSGANQYRVDICLRGITPQTAPPITVYINNTLGRILYEGNWFDGEWKQGYPTSTTTWDNNTKVVSQPNSNMIKVSEGDIIKASFDAEGAYIGFFTFDKDKNYISDLSVKNASVVEKTIQSGVAYFTTYYQSISAITPSTAPHCTVTINGKLATIVDCVGKNLFDGVSVLNAYFSLSGTIASNADSKTVFTKCKPNTTYTISKKAGERFRVAYTKETPNFNTSIYGAIEDFTANSISITTGADAKYIIAYVYNVNNDSITWAEMLASIQIEEGTEATDYVPYHHSRTYLPHNGIYSLNELRDEIVVADGEYKELKRVGVVDLGTLTWTKTSDSTRFYSKDFSVMKLIPRTEVANILCDKFETSDFDSASTKSNVICVYDSSSTNYLTVVNSSYNTMTASEFKSAMSGTILLYEPAEPTLVDLPQEPYYSIRTFDGETNIEIVSELDMACEIKVANSEDGAMVIEGYATAKINEEKLNNLLNPPIEATSTEEE